MGQLTINDKYSVAQFGYEDGNVTLSGSARYNKDGELTNVDGQATKDGVMVGNWNAYRAEGRIKLSMSNFEATDLVVVLPVINECVAALENEE